MSETKVRTKSEPVEELLPQAEETPKAKKEKAPKESKKTPAPEGYVTPVAFAKTIGVPPQQVYGMIKNMKGFPVLDRGEGVIPRIVINEAEAQTFISERAAARAAAKAEKAAKAASTDAPAA